MREPEFSVRSLRGGDEAVDSLGGDGGAHQQGSHPEAGDLAGRQPLHARMPPSNHLLLPERELSWRIEDNRKLEFEGKMRENCESIGIVQARLPFRSPREKERSSSVVVGSQLRSKIRTDNEWCPIISPVKLHFCPPSLELGKRRRGREAQGQPAWARSEATPARDAAATPAEMQALDRNPLQQSYMVGYGASPSFPATRRTTAPSYRLAPTADGRRAPTIESWRLGERLRATTPHAGADDRIGGTAHGWARGCSWGGGGGGVALPLESRPDMRGQGQKCFSMRLTRGFWRKRRREGDDAGHAARCRPARRRRQLSPLNYPTTGHGGAQGLNEWRRQRQIDVWRRLSSRLSLSLEQEEEAAHRVGTGSGRGSRTGEVGSRV